MIACRPLRRYLLVLAAFIVLLWAPLGHAQTTPCKDPWINQAYTRSMLRPPSGSGVTGECNPQRYEGGNWTDFQDLTLHIVHSTDCPDPWIGQIYFSAYARKPTSAECNASNYGGGHWGNYGDLRGKINSYQTAIQLSPNQLYVALNGDMLNNQGRVVYPNAVSNILLKVINTDNAGFVGNNGSALTSVQRTALVNRLTGLTAAQKASIISQDGNGLTAAQRSNIILNAGGNLSATEKQQLISNQASLVGPSGGTLVGPSGGTFVSPAAGQVVNTNGSNYTLASVGGKQVLAVTSISKR